MHSIKNLMILGLRSYKTVTNSLSLLQCKKLHLSCWLTWAAIGTSLHDILFLQFNTLESTDLQTGRNITPINARCVCIYIKMHHKITLFLLLDILLFKVLIIKQRVSYTKIRTKCAT